jgi:hypothetical protein
VRGYSGSGPFQVLPAAAGRCACACWYDVYVAARRHVRTICHPDVIMAGLPPLAVGHMHGWIVCSVVFGALVHSSVCCTFTAAPSPDHRGRVAHTSEYLFMLFWMSWCFLLLLSAGWLHVSCRYNCREPGETALLQGADAACALHGLVLCRTPVTCIKRRLPVAPLPVDTFDTSLQLQHIRYTMTHTCPGMHPIYKT